MIYQVRTFNYLCSSKKYFTTKEEIGRHIEKVLKSTVIYRWKRLTDKTKIPLPISIRESDIETGVVVTQIADDMMKLFGEEKEICDPYEPTTKKKKAKV